MRVVGGFAFKSEDFSNEGIPVVRISDLKNDSVFITGAARIPSERIGRGQDYCIEPGDILIAMSGATTGKIGVVQRIAFSQSYKISVLETLRLLTLVEFIEIPKTLSCFINLPVHNLAVNGGGCTTKY